MFYAIEYAYGRNVINHGQRPNEVYAFDTAAERDAFVRNRVTEYSSQSGYRAAPSSASAYVQRARRLAKHYHGIDDWPSGTYIPLCD